jgi:hypothetical protein
VLGDERVFRHAGSPAGYNGRATQGNRGWSFGEVLPFFCRLEADACGGYQGVR